MFKILSRFIWLAILVVGLGIPITNFTLAKQLAGMVWEKGYSMVYPPPIVPGPIAVNLGSDPITTVIVSADDGKDSWYEIQYPILQKYRLPCTQFVIPLRVGDYQFMTWDQIKEIKKWGCDVQSHTMTHPDLTKLSKEEAKYQIEGSRKALAEKMGYAPTVIASPSGSYNRQILESMREAGYEAHVLGFGGEDDKVNEAMGGLLNPFELIRFDVKNYHKAEDVCNAVKKAEGKSQILIFVYHFAARRPEPGAKTQYKSFGSIGVQVPGYLHVFEDVFDGMMACIAEERDAGRIRLSSIPEALSFYREREDRERLVTSKTMERICKESPLVVTLPVQPKKQVQLVKDDPVRRKEVPEKRPQRRNIHDVTIITTEERRR